MRPGILILLFLFVAALISVVGESKAESRELDKTHACRSTDPAMGQKLKSSAGSTLSPRDGRVLQDTRFKEAPQVLINLAQYKVKPPPGGAPGTTRSPELGPSLLLPEPNPDLLTPQAKKPAAIQCLPPPPGPVIKP